MKHYDSRAFRTEIDSCIEPHPLDERLTAKRAERFRQVLARRTVRLTVVIDDCYDPHNATAVLRTSEAFGLDEIHVVTPRNRFAVNRSISQGSHLYTRVRSHSSIRDAYESLRQEGFMILASNLEAEAVVDPHDLSRVVEETPLALVFGNEESGVSETGIAESDGSFFVPMSGCTQSLNLSVTVAVTLFSIRHKSLASEAVGDMPCDLQRSRYDSWIRRQVERGR